MSLLARWREFRRCASLRPALRLVITEVLAGPPFDVEPGSPASALMVVAVNQARTANELRYVAMASLAALSRRMDEFARAQVRRQAADAFEALTKVIESEREDVPDRKELN